MMHSYLGVHSLLKTNTDNSLQIVYYEPFQSISQQCANMKDSTDTRFELELNLHRHFFLNDQFVVYFMVMLFLNQQHLERMVKCCHKSMEID